MTVSQLLFSNKLPNKSKNGDAVSSFDIEDLGLSFFLLADGVGGCVGDYKASDTAVEVFELCFRESDEKNIPKRISNSIEEINNLILSETGYYQGMKTTLVVTVLDIKNSVLYYSSIGDSRLYRIDSTTVEQLSMDEVKAVVRKKQDGSPIVQGGAIVNAIGVSNVIGTKLLQHDVKSIKIEESSSFLLASDGFYDKMIDADVYLPKMHKTLYFDNQFRHLQEDVQRQQDDDASAIFFRIIKEEDNQLWKAQKQIFDNLLDAIESKDEKKAISITRTISLSQYDNTFNFYDTAIKRMRAIAFNSSALYSELVGLLRESRRSY